jgi:hypothetical protein
MAAIALAIMSALAVAGCSDEHPLTFPTSTSAAPVAERWTLDLTVREVYGAGACDAGVGSIRTVPLGIEFGVSHEVVMYYDSDSQATDRLAHWTGWLSGLEVEASGLTFESLPCSGAHTGAAGTLTLLTGYFSPDRQSFAGTEMRRYTVPGPNEVVFYLALTTDLGM